MELDNSTAIMDLIMPDGLIINTLAVYYPSHEDDSKYWVKVRKALDEREWDARLILGDFNSTLDLDRDTMNYVSDPHSRVRPLLRQWLLNRDFLDVYDEFHPGEISFTWFQNKNDVYRSKLESPVGKMSRLYHILSTLLSWIQSVEHVRMGRDVSDHKAVIMGRSFTLWCKHTQRPNI